MFWHSICWKQTYFVLMFFHSSQNFIFDDFFQKNLNIQSETDVKKWLNVLTELFANICMLENNNLAIFIAVTTEVMIFHRHTGLENY